MCKTRLLLAFAAFVFLGGSAAVLGCGDKFVVLGRGMRLGRASPAKFPGAVLIYVNPASHMPAAMKEFRLEATIKGAGHKTRVVESGADLEQALASGKYDIVLADIADSPGVQKGAAIAASKPSVIPVLYKPTPAELAEVEKKYGCLIAPASSRSPDLLPVLDLAMQSRAKGLGLRCQTVS
jgi:CheY-like chemotaxis protein